MHKLNGVQKAAYELIREDARFLYSLTDISMHVNKNISGNYLSMCLPYLGVFADGAEQWCRKAGVNAPQFNTSEKKFYQELRLSHKLFDKSYVECRNELNTALLKSDVNCTPDSGQLNIECPHSMDN